MYKRRREFFIYRLLFYLLVPLYFSYILYEKLPKVSLIYLVGIIIIYLNFEFFIKRLTRILISGDYIYFTYINNFRTINEKYKLHNIKYSYKYEVGGKGTRHMEMRFYLKENKLYTGIGFGLDGWNKKTLELLIERLEDYGLEQVD